MFDMQFIASDIVVVLLNDKFYNYNLKGEVINSVRIRTDSYSRIACINHCKIAVSVPGNDLIEIVTIIAPTQITDLITPVGTRMTGGITCRMDILYVAFSDAIRLMDLSGQIQKLINIPSVNILHSVNNDKMLCVYSKDNSDKTMSCLDFTNDSVYDFEQFPFYPEDVTTDESGNIIFVEDNVIWQADSDGKNITIIISGKITNRLKV
ncbi:unnamed protein product [Mytilus edulis]|uniref:Uncharacterized protein n=1 Tax=Mytilus edulis TaxID=6550 RepID=A0A8S3SHG4_MYTED|nr:unnamed protein product [Mytilus edulis]